MGCFIQAPFEFRVLECLLASTSRYFEAKSRRLAFLMEGVLTDVTRSASDSRFELQRLLPIQRWGCLTRG